MDHQRIKRCTLVKDQVGNGRRSTSELPPPDFVYGVRTSKDCGTKDIFENWPNVRSARRRSSHPSRVIDPYTMEPACIKSTLSKDPIKSIIQTDYTSYENHDGDYPRIPPRKKIIAFPPPKATLSSLLAKKVHLQRLEEANMKEPFKMSKFKRVPSRLGLNLSCHMPHHHTGDGHGDGDENNHNLSDPEDNDIIYHNTHNLNMIRSKSDCQIIHMSTSLPSSPEKNRIKDHSNLRRNTIHGHGASVMFTTEPQKKNNFTTTTTTTTTIGGGGGGKKNGQLFPSPTKQKSSTNNLKENTSKENGNITLKSNRKPFPDPLNKSLSSCPMIHNRAKANESPLMSCILSHTM